MECHRPAMNRDTPWGSHRFPFYSLQIIIPCDCIETPEELHVFVAL
jgi:hypothetical protein